MTTDFDEILRPVDDECRVALGDHETLVRVRGDGPPIVLIHSLGLDARMWERTAELLAEAGARTFAYDVRGHGSATDAPPAAGVDDLVADLARLLDGLGLERATIAGTSMGGVLTQAFTASHPDRVAAAAILTSPALGVPAFEERAVAAETGGMASIEAGTLERWFNAERVEQDGPEVRYARALLATWPLEQWAASWRVLGSFVPPGRDELPTVPTVLVAGEADPSTPPSLMEQIRERTPGDPEMVVLPDAPHLAVLTHHVDVARILGDLIRS
jgi:3-oxoadipate enol-lactonase